MTERTPAVLETLALLDRAGVLTPTSLALEADLSLEEFTALGVALDRLHDSSNWWIADWLLIGEQRFGENLAQAAAALQRSERTLQNYAWVASHVAPSRRREALSFTHHVLVAPFDPAEQTRWLEQAEREGWSSRELGERIEAGRTLTPVLDVQTIVDRTAQRLSRRLPEEAGVEITARLGEQSYHATIIPAVPPIPTGHVEGEIVTCHRHGSKSVERIVAGITYLTCGCRA